jgi:hypothetical protein
MHLIFNTLCFCAQNTFRTHNLSAQWLHWSISSSQSYMSLAKFGKHEIKTPLITMWGWQLVYKVIIKKHLTLQSKRPSSLDTNGIHYMHVTIPSIYFPRKQTLLYFLIESLSYCSNYFKVPNLKFNFVMGTWVKFDNSIQYSD